MVEGDRVEVRPGLEEVLERLEDSLMALNVEVARRQPLKHRRHKARLKKDATKNKSLCFKIMWEILNFHSASINQLLHSHFRAYSPCFVGSIHP